MTSSKTQLQRLRELLQFLIIPILQECSMFDIGFNCSLDIRRISCFLRLSLLSEIANQICGQKCSNATVKMPCNWFVPWFNMQNIESYHAKHWIKALIIKVADENKAKQLNRRPSFENSGIFKFSSGYSFLFTLAIWRRFFSAFLTWPWVRYQRVDSGVSLNWRMR